MEPVTLKGFSFRVSTAFALLGLAALALELLGPGVTWSAITAVLGQALAGVIFVEYGPFWCLIAIVLALGYAIHQRTKWAALLQHGTELLLCAAAIPFFPTH